MRVPTSWRKLKEKEPKRIFRAGGMLYWACNGQRIRDAHYTEWKGAKMWLSRMGHPRVRVEMVNPPPGRCPHCGEKV